MAVYRPIGFDPNKTTRNMLEEQIFTAIVQSTTTDYQIQIFDISDNSLKYDSGKVNLATTLYATETLSITIPITVAMATVRNLKYYITVWNGTENAFSREIPFTNYENPILTVSVPSTVDTQSYEFVGTQTQAQGIDASRYKYTLYANNSTQIATSDWIYNSSLKYTFENFVNNTTYKIKCESYDANELYAVSATYTFIVEYEEPSVTITPTVENIKEMSAIKVGWGGAYIVEGDLTGTSSYVENFLYGENYGLSLTSGSYVDWEDVFTNQEYVISFIYSGDKTGDLLTLSNTDTLDYITIGHDGTRFYRNQNGVYKYTTSIPLLSSNAYLIMMNAENIMIKQFPIGGDWESWSASTWGFLANNFTWQQILG